jgi:hypothetical protein
MYPRDAQTSGNFLRALLVALSIILAIAFAFPWPSRPVISRWAGPQAIFAAVPNLIVTAAESDAPAEIVGLAAPQAPSLDRYNQASQLVDTDPSQHVSYYRRDLPGGGILAYFVVQLSEYVHIEVLNADGATPGSDASGDTIWTDGQPHLATVAEIVQAPYAARDGLTLLGAMAFGFHGDVRTSDEGSVVINGEIRRVNPGRAALCITRDGRAEIGRYDAKALEQCEQAIGAGPVVLWQGKIANPAVTSETSQFLPFNPLNEDFVLLDWRRKIYSGNYPKSVIGIGTEVNGTPYLIMVTSYGVTGVDLAGQLKAMGCSAALGGDDDTSTQAVWRGAVLQPRNVREVPDAVAVYVRR